MNMGISTNGHKTQIIHFIFIKFSRYSSDNVEHMEMVHNLTNDTVRTVKFVIVLYNTLAFKWVFFSILERNNSHFHRKQHFLCTPQEMLYEEMWWVQCRQSKLYSRHNYSERKWMSYLWPFMYRCKMAFFKRAWQKVKVQSCLWSIKILLEDE